MGLGLARSCVGAGGPTVFGVHTRARADLPRDEFSIRSTYGAWSMEAGKGVMHSVTQYMSVSVY